MDLLGSILKTMDKPPTASEREKKAAKELKEKLEKEQEIEQKRRDKLKKKILVQVGEFLSGSEKMLKFDPMDKIQRAIVHDVAGTAGLVTYSFGSEEDETKHVVGFKKEHAPSEEELVYLRKGEAVPTAQQQQQQHASQTTISVDTRPAAAVAPATDYREKYKHLIATQIAEPSAMKTEPERKFGFVTSANKRDLRSIEEAMQDIRSKKKLKLMPEEGNNQVKADSIPNGR